jgi:hypothetical protein
MKWLIAFDEENAAEEWFAAADEAVATAPESARRVYEALRGAEAGVVVDDRDREAFLSWASTLPGWDTGPEYAREPVLSAPFDIVVAVDEDGAIWGSGYSADEARVDAVEWLRINGRNADGGALTADEAERAADRLAYYRTCLHFDDAVWFKRTCPECGQEATMLEV